MDLQQQQQQQQDQWSASLQTESLTTQTPQTAPTCMGLIPQINQDFKSVITTPSKKQYNFQSDGQNSSSQKSPLTVYPSPHSVSEMTLQESPSELESQLFPRRKRVVKLPRSEIQQWQNIIAGYRLHLGDKILETLSRNYPES